MKKAPILDRIKERLLQLADDQERSHVMDSIVYAAFTVVAAAMSAVNVVTMRIPLLISTLVFMVLCLLSFILVRFARKGKAGRIVFLAGMIVLFGFFIITGGTDNFSIVWVLLLPALGLFFFGIKKGSILSGIILIMMLVCFFVPPLSEICTDYGRTFEIRFPLVYAACYVVALFLEVVRLVTLNALRDTQEKYKNLYSIDQLTGIYNRYMIDDMFADALNHSSGNIAVAIGDIDWFKNFNDTYGHQTGDEVLKFVAHTIRDNIPEDATVVRWGGEEFLILYANGDDAISNIQNVHRLISETEHVFHGSKSRVTISFGLVTSEKDKFDSEGLSYLEKIADNNLYKAKESGRNRIVATAF